MCKLGVIVVTRAADQIVEGESTPEARAVVQQRRPRDPAFARIPRAVACNSRSVRKALLLLICK